jgi:membrane protease YdiL (CAAX protease family)
LNDKLKNPFTAIIITGVTFGVFHQNFYQFIPIAFIGILFGFIFYKTQNLWITIFIHIFYNTSQVVLFYLHKTNRITFDIDNSESIPLWLEAISLIGGAFSFYKLYTSKLNTTHE